MRDTGTIPFRKIKHRGFVKPVYKTELVDKVAKDTRLSQRITSDVVNSAIKTITAGLKGKRWVVLPGFGMFYSRVRRSSKVRSFTTGKLVDVLPQRVVGFRPGELPKFVKCLLRRSTFLNLYS